MYSNFRFLSLVICMTSACGALHGEGVDHWGICPASPAVVNSVTTSPLQAVISLRGEWEFATDSGMMGRHRMGKGPDWNEPDWSHSSAIQVPGCWEAQGVGEPGMSLPWDPIFDRIPRPMNHIYMGAARYRRFVTIPEDWKGKRIWLKIGGVRTEAYIWVNHKRVAHLNTYCGTYKYDITEHVVPGENAEIVATVRNDTPSRKGCKAAFHRFGGFYRDIELEATPAIWIEDVWVRGDLAKHTAAVNLAVLRHEIASPTMLSAQVQIKTPDGAVVGNQKQAIMFNGQGSAELTCDIPMTEYNLWTPETPHLYLAEVVLLDGDAPLHGWVERFGLRKLEVRGDRFYLNDKPFLVRGFGDDYIYPISLISPPDRNAHLEHLLLARQAGFNYVRHHTHCEIPEFFEAADEAGILIQPELPYYHDITTEGFEFDPMRDIRELYRHYRRYVSFASYSTGNEGHLGNPLDQQIYQWAKRMDPDRIFQHQDGGCNTLENSDYFSPNGYGLTSSIVPWPPGAFDGLTVPFIAHEYLNLGIKMDPRLAPKFTGAIPSPRSLDEYEQSLRNAGLNRFWGDACLDSAHALQGYYQKRGIEQARRDPACDGYSYWTLVDVMVGQGGTYTGQGFLNAFWEEKSGGLTREQFYCFNGPTALLATFNTECAIAVSGDVCTAHIWISQYGDWPDKETGVTWSVSSQEQTYAEGMLPVGALAIGTVKELGAIQFSVPQIDHPVHVVFNAVLQNTDIANAWDFWFFPERRPRSGNDIAVTDDLLEALSKRYPGIVPAASSEAVSADLVIGSWDHPELIALTQQGMRGIMIGPAEGEPNIKLGWWSLGDQVGTAFLHHPVFGAFPHNGALNPLWFRLIKRGLPLPVNPEFGSFDFYAVGEGRDRYFAYVLKKNSQKGSPLLMTHGVDLLADTPEGAFLLDALIDYAQSEAFLKQQRP